MASIRSRHAHAAFAARNSDLSRAVHQSTELAEIASGKSDFLHGIPPTACFTRSSVSSGIRGSVGALLLTSCVDVFPAHLHTTYWLIGAILLSCLSYLVSWFDQKMMAEFIDFERQRERWEVENFPEGEIQEMVQIYTGYGVSDTDALLVAKTLSKYPEFWVEHMLLHEIGVVSNDKSTDVEETSVTDKLIPILIFHFTLLFPLASLYLSSSSRFAWMVGMTQCLIFLETKRRTSQWLSGTSVIGVALVIIFATFTLSVAVNLFVPLS